MKLIAGSSNWEWIIEIQYKKKHKAFRNQRIAPYIFPSIKQKVYSLLYCNFNEFSHFDRVIYKYKWMNECECLLASPDRVVFCYTMHWRWIISQIFKWKYLVQCNFRTFQMIRNDVCWKYTQYHWMVFTPMLITENINVMRKHKQERKNVSTECTQQIALVMQTILMPGSNQLDIFPTQITENNNNFQSVETAH